MGASLTPPRRAGISRASPPRPARTAGSGARSLTPAAERLRNTGDDRGASAQAGSSSATAAPKHGHASALCSVILSLSKAAPQAVDFEGRPACPVPPRQPPRAG